MARRQRLFLSTKDVAVLHQFTLRTARNLIKKIRIVFGKLPYQSITVREYGLYMDVDEETVIRVLNDEA